MSSLYKFLLPLKSVILLKKCWNHFAQCEVTSYHYKIMKYPTQAQTHTSFLHFTETSQSFHNKYIFNTKNFVQVEIWKMVWTFFFFFFTIFKASFEENGTSQYRF